MALMFDREVGDAAPRIQLIGRGKGFGGADIETRPAASARIFRRIVGRQIEGGEYLRQKKPRAEIARYQIAVLALPAEAGARRQRFLHHRRGIDEQLDLNAMVARDIAGELLQALFQHLVIILALRIDGYRAALTQFKNILGRVPGSVIGGQHDDALCFGPELAGIAAPRRVIGHPGHVAVKATRQIFL